MSARRDKPPTVQATPTRRGLLWVVVCPHCGDKHFHSPQAGHRTSDCDSAGGYIVAAPRESK